MAFGFFKFLLGHSQSLSKREWVNTIKKKNHFVENRIENAVLENCDRVNVMSKFMKNLLNCS